MEDDQLSIQELETLRLTALDLTSELESKQLLEKIIQRSRELLGADAGGIYLFSEAEQQLKVEFYSGDGPSMLGTTLEMGEGLVGKVVQEGEEVIVDNYSQWNQRSLLLDSSPFRAVIGVPLVTPTKKLGALYLINYDEGKRFDKRDARLLKVLASHAAIALANAAEFEQHRRTLRQLELINRLNERLNHAVDVDEVLQVTLEESLKAVRTREGSVMMLDDKTEELEIKAWVVKGRKANFKDHKKFALSEGVAGYVARTGQPYNCVDTSKSDFFVPSFTNRKIGALLSVPIILHHRVFCIINADSKKPNSFTDLDMEMLSALAGHVAIAIESQMLRDIGISLSALPLEELYPSIVKSAAMLTGSDVSTIFLLDEKDDSVSRAALFPSSIQATEGEARGDGLTRSILNKGKLVRLTGASLTKLARPAVLSRGVKSLLGAPLTVRLEDDVKTIGVLFVSTTRERHYEKRDEEILQSLANQAAVVIERTRNLIDLKENVLFKESLLQNAFDAIVAVNAAGKILICNHSAQKILGLDEGEAEGRNVAEFFLRPEDAEKVARSLELEGRVRNHYTDVKSKNGEAIPIRLSSIRLEKGSVGFFQDRRELESAKRHREQLKQLMEAGQAITELSNEGGVLETVVARTIETLKADLVCLYSYDHEQGKIQSTPVCAGTLADPGKHGAIFPLSTVEAIVRQGDLCFAGDVHKDPLVDGTSVPKEIASVVASPLAVRDKIVGVIFCSYCQPHPFSDGEEQAMMRLYFNVVATAIENARLYDEVQQRAKVIQGLYKAGLVPLLGSDPDQHLRALLDQVRQVTDAQYAGMKILRSEQSVDPLLITSGQQLELSRSRMETPIVLGKQRIGSLYVADKRRAERFNTKDEEYLKMLAGSAATLIELARFKQQAAAVQSIDVAFLLLSRWARMIRERTRPLKKYVDQAERRAKPESEILRELSGVLKQMESPLEPGYHSVERDLNQNVNVSKLLRKAAAQVKPRLMLAAAQIDARKAGVLNLKDIEGNCWIKGNSLLLEMAMNILVDNAVTAIEKKAEEPVKLAIECSSDDDSVHISISDTGTGISTEIKKDLFQVPLSAWENGFGHGALAVGMIFRVHKGSIRIAETGAKGTVLDIRLPADRR